MQPSAQEISTCPVCGGPLEETSGGGLGCMVCLLRFGIGGEEDVAQEAATAGDERFGVYEIERREDGTLYELGHGGMGAAYRAIDTALQRKVALKIIRIGVGGRSTEARERFLHEARAAATLRHENIATVFQFGIREETGQCFYAMELIEGETLEDRVRRAGPLSVRTTIDIARQVTAALIAAEKRGLIHRDLKPANLMLVPPEDETAGASTQRGGYNNVRGVVATALRRRAGRNADRTDRNDEKLLVKIIDFGLAKALNAQIDPMSLIRHRFVGTPAFASPEQFEHSELDVRSDIYSLGVTLWFALTGKTPFARHGGNSPRSASQCASHATAQGGPCSFPPEIADQIDARRRTSDAPQPTRIGSAIATLCGGSKPRKDSGHPRRSGSRRHSHSRRVCTFRFSRSAYPKFSSESRSAGEKHSSAPI
jgi:serine/threonine protein kinase